RQQAIDEVYKPFKPTRISFLLIPTMRDGTCPIDATIRNETDTLSGNRRGAILKPLCKKHCAKIGEAPSTSGIGLDQTLRLQSGKNCTTALRKRLPHKLKVAVVIQASQDIFIGHKPIRNAALPNIGLQFPPKGSEPVRMVGQPRRRAAYADIRRPLKLDRAGNGSRNLQKD